jgi:hypothetical protein
MLTFAVCAYPFRYRAQCKRLHARVAELEAKLGQPPKTPDSSSLLLSRGQKANAEPPATKPPRKGHPGVARKLAETRARCAALCRLNMCGIRPMRRRRREFGGTAPTLKKGA